MRKYEVLPSFTDDMGTFEGFTVEARDIEDARKEALWFYNSARDHDSLPPWSSLPRHIRVVRS